MTLSRTFERWTTVAALFILVAQILPPEWPARAAVGPEAAVAAHAAGAVGRPDRQCLD